MQQGSKHGGATASSKTAGHSSRVALLASVALGLAMAPRAEALELPLDQAIARAIERSPEVRRARASRLSVESRRVGAAIVLPSNPVIAGSAGLLHVASQTLGGVTSPAGSGVQWGAHLEQAIEVGGQRGARLDEVERGVEGGRKREELAIAEARAAVRAAYAGAWIAGERVAAERVREQLVSQLLESIELRVKSGAASGVDLALAQTELGRVVAGRIAAEVEELGQLARLAILVGAPAGEPLRITTALGEPGAGAGAGPGAGSGAVGGELPPLEVLVARALERRADFAVLAATAAELDAQDARYGREAVPTPTLFVDVVGQLETGAQPGQLYAGGGVALPLPLARRYQGERASNRADRARLDAERDVLVAIVTQEVALARQEMISRRAEADLYGRTVLPAAEAAARLTTEGYRSGKFDLFRVIAAARDVAEARRERLSALGALWQARIALDRAMGEP